MASAEERDEGENEQLPPLEYESDEEQDLPASTSSDPAPGLQAAARHAPAPIPLLLVTLLCMHLQIVLTLLFSVTPSASLLYLSSRCFRRVEV